MSVAILRKYGAERAGAVAPDHDAARRAFDRADEPPEGCVAFGADTAAASDRFETVRTDPEEPALIHFTSGATGKPKGAVHVRAAIVAHRETGRVALDLREGDVFWRTGDPGWATGASWEIFSPPANAATLVVDEAEFDFARWGDILERERV